MQKSNLVLGLLLPTNQDASEAVQPTVGAFDYPPSGSLTSLAGDFLPLPRVSEYGQ
jgi:hypothetical protein